MIIATLVMHQAQMANPTVKRSEENKRYEMTSEFVLKLNVENKDPRSVNARRGNSREGSACPVSNRSVNCHMIQWFYSDFLGAVSRRIQMLTGHILTQLDRSLRVTSSDRISMV